MIEHLPCKLFYVDTSECDNFQGIAGIFIYVSHNKAKKTLDIVLYSLTNDLIYFSFYTGGKFDNATGETGYNTSGGEHGTGGKAVNALSIKMVVTTSRDGIKEIVEFSQGKFIKYFS